VIHLILLGAAGKMGRAVSAALPRFPEMTLEAALEHPAHPELGALVIPDKGQQQAVRLSSQWPNELPAGSVLIDFSNPESCIEAIGMARRLRTPVVSGTTGLSPEQQARLVLAAEEIPIVQSPNMAIGVNILFSLLESLSRNLPANFDIEVIEAHHRHKADAPSGTALRILQILESRGTPRVGRWGRTGERDSHEIGIHALRLGGHVGEHTVRACSASEEISLTHRALDRGLFAEGALLAASFIVRQSSGLFGMKDVLGL